MLDKNGERGRNRTFNLLIKSQLLCQLSYAPAPSKHSRWLDLLLRETVYQMAGCG